MPTYLYTCPDCGEFERDQRIVDPPLQRCPKCRKVIRRLIAKTTFILTGGGWTKPGMPT